MWKTLPFEDVFPIEHGDFPMFVMLVFRGVYQIPRPCGEGFLAVCFHEPANQTPLGMTGRWLGRLGTDRYTVYFTIFILNGLFPEKVVH